MWLRRKKKKKDGAQIFHFLIQYQTKIYFKQTLSGARNLGSFITLVLPNEFNKSILKS